MHSEGAQIEQHTATHAHIQNQPLQPYTHTHTHTHSPIVNSGFRTPNPTQYTTVTRNTTTIPGEGHCKIELQITYPGGVTGGPPDTARTSRNTVLIVGSAQDQSLVKAVTGAGFVAVEVTVCGFGEDKAFPTSYKGMAACPDLAQNLNRSIVGVSADSLLE